MFLLYCELTNHSFPKVLLVLTGRSYEKGNEYSPTSGKQDTGHRASVVPSHRMSALNAFFFLFKIKLLKTIAPSSTPISTTSSPPPPTLPRLCWLPPSFPLPQGCS